MGGWWKQMEKKTHPMNNEYQMPDRLTNQLYGEDILNTWINDKARNVPSIEKIREITAKIPSLTKFLLDDRNDE